METKVINKTGLLNAVINPAAQTEIDEPDWRLVPDDPFAQGMSVSAVAVAAVAKAVPLKAVLFLQEAGDTAAISVNDLHQGQLGDCFLIASIGELALTHPDAITKMIKVNANGTETVTLYTDKNGHVANYGTTVFKATTITIDNTFSSAGVNNGATQDVLNGQKEIWPQVLEKAIATLDGGYNTIANGGNPMIVMQELTGHAASFMSAAALTIQKLQAFIAEGDLIAMDTGGGGLPFNLVNSHAYMFEKLTITNGAAMVQVGNPWGTNQAAAIPFSQLSKAFVEVDIGHFV
jgi:hypothetical protein